MKIIIGIILAMTMALVSASQASEVLINLNDILKVLLENR